MLQQVKGVDTAMTRALLLDSIVGAEFPRFVTEAEVAAFEQVPIGDRLAAASTYEALRLGALRDPNAPAIQYLATASATETPLIVTHSQFVARVTQAANMFHGLGVGPGDVVSFLLPLLPQAFVTLFGAAAAGISNPVNPLLEPKQIAEILDASQTKVLVALGPLPGTDIWQKVEKVRPHLKHLVAIVQVGGAGDPANGIHDFDDLIARQPAGHLIGKRTIAPEDTAAYFHTGGTTGTPKLVRHTHRNQVYQAWACNLMLKARPGANLLFGMPLFHVGGSLTQSLAVLSNGGSLIVLSPSGWRNPAAFANLWPLVARYKPQTLSSVPTVLAASLAVPFGDHDVSSIKFCAGGGSAIPVAVGKALQERHKAPVIEVCGMTETASVHTLAYPDRPLRLGSVGHAIPYSRVRVVKVDGDGYYLGDCATNEIGVVAMAGPGVFSGYLNEAHNKDAFVEPGWINSGDLGRLDEDGYLWIAGRSKDVVIRGGHNIDPGPIEDVLFQHPAVGLAAVIGQPDARVGELPVAYVQLKPGASLVPGELENWVRERTPERAAVPVAVHVIATMPLTGVGKVFKPQLRWDASEKVFRKTLAPLGERGVRCDVAVDAHGTHGSLARITVHGATEDQQALVASEIAERLAPFVLRHEIAWA